MEVLRAKSAGFCFGVKRAVEEVYERLKEGREIFTYGPIIHNEEVVKDLEKRGVRVIDGEKELSDLKEGTLVIRSHGVPQKIYELVRENNLECIDMTCPFVKRIHTIVEKESANGQKIIIIGNAGHPEVEGIMGWSHTPAVVIESKAEAENFVNDPQNHCALSPRRHLTTTNFKN